jgi:hypothetical protein
MSFQDSRNEYGSKLTRKGFVKIGDGLNADVYTKIGSDRVIKVGSRRDIWPEYIEWATKNGYAGTFAPKVYSLKYHDHIFVAEMERLVCTISDILNNMGRDHIYCRLQRAITHIIYGYEIDAAEIKDQVELKEATDLITFIRDIQEARFNNDLHNQNWMLRKDGQIVLIDPSSFESYAHKLRIKRGEIITPSRGEEQCNSMNRLRP